MNQVPTPQMMLPPMALPCSITLEQLQASNGQLIVRLQLHTPAGVTIGHMPPEEAVRLGETLTRIGRAMQNGIYVPGGGLQVATPVAQEPKMMTLGMSDEEIAEAERDNVRPFRPQSLGQ